ncbi:MAG: hypothetical protein V3U02_11350 [Calditrichia bacterium]
MVLNHISNFQNRMNECGTWDDINILIKKNYDGIYFDQLQELFTDATGLYTHL